MIRLTNAVVLVNNEPVGIVPNSFTYREGKGEQKVTAVSVGNDQVESVYSDDVESKVGYSKFSIPTTADNIALALEWKNNKNGNVLVATGSTADGGKFDRTFTGAALTSDYEVAIGVDAVIEVEFMSNPAI